VKVFSETTVDVLSTSALSPSSLPSTPSESFFVSDDVIWLSPLYSYVVTSPFSVTFVLFPALSYSYEMVSILESLSSSVSLSVSSPEVSVSVFSTVVDMSLFRWSYRLDIIMQKER